MNKEQTPITTEELLILLLKGYKIHDNIIRSAIPFSQISNSYYELDNVRDKIDEITNRSKSKV